MKNATKWAAATALAAAWACAAGAAGEAAPGEERAAPSAGYNWEVAAEDGLGPVGNTFQENWAFALDRRGEPHFVYVTRTYNKNTSASDYALKYTRRAKGKWLTETIPAATPGFYDLSPALKLDARGNAVVAFLTDCSLSSYVRDQRRTLTVARRTAKGWALTDVEAAMFDISPPALALDGRGNPHVAYSRQKTLAEVGPPSLCYASWTGDRWLIELVGEGGGRDPSLALDARDRPHISYCNGMAPAYAHRGDAGWEFYTPEENDPDRQISDNSIAVDAAGRPYIAYRGGDDLKVLFRTDAGWETQTVDEAGNVGFGCALALDGRGLPYISYRSRYDVKFAHGTADGWFVQTVAYSRYICASGGMDSIDLGRNTAIALDADGRPRVYFVVRERGEDLIYLASWRGGAWQLPPEGEAETIPDLSAEMRVTPWGPEVAALRAGEPWPAVTRAEYAHGYEREEPWPLYAAPAADLRKENRPVGEIPPATAVKVVDAKSVWTLYTPMLSEEDEAATYCLWFRVRAGGKEGWLEGDALARPDALVRFAASYAPLRESPSARAPAVRPEELDWRGAGWGVAAEVAAGEFYPLSGRCRDWLAVGSGWLPAATPGLEFYARTFGYNAGDEGADFEFYFPVAEDVARVYYSMWGPYFAPYFDDHAVLTITTADGRSSDAVLEKRVNLSWHETVYHYGEAALTEPVKRADVVAVTLTLGERGERIRATVDPRPAWAGK